MKEIDPKQTNRAMAFELWMNVPMPMVTLFKTLDVTNLVKLSRKYNYKFNMLMCWCIGKAAKNTSISLTSRSIFPAKLVLLSMMRK